MRAANCRDCRPVVRFHSPANRPAFEGRGKMTVKLDLQKGMPKTSRSGYFTYRLLTTSVIYIMTNSTNTLPANHCCAPYENENPCPCRALRTDAVGLPVSDHLESRGRGVRRRGDGCHRQA